MRGLCELSRDGRVHPGLRTDNLASFLEGLCGRSVALEDGRDVIFHAVGLARDRQAEWNLAAPQTPEVPQVLGSRKPALLAAVNDFKRPAFERGVSHLLEDLDLEILEVDDHPRVV